jgi:DNA-binding response OmpR family regulator
MRVLVAADSKVEREALTRVLQTCKHRVEVVGDAKAALAALAREAAQVVVHLGTSSAAIDLLRKVRAAESTEHGYFIAVLDKVTPGEIVALYAAGIDDLARKPLSAEELTARIDGPLRIREYAAKLLRSTSYDWSSAVDVRNLRAFADTASIVATDLAQLVGHELQVTVPGPSDPRVSGLRCASIPMNLAADGVELRISLVAEPAALAALARTVMGEDVDEGARLDLLRELANTAGGALKRAYATEGVVLTTGLPVDGHLPPQDATTRWWTARAATLGVAFGLVCELRVKNNERVPACSLREGMVLIHDLRNESGALLVAAGTRLTVTSAERVGRALGERFLVEVVRAA